MSLLGNVAELAILLKLKDEFTGPLGKAEHALGGLNSRTASVTGGLGTMGKGLAVAAERIAAISITAATGVAAIAVSATKAASSFQAAMELIHTQAGASQEEVDALSKSVLALAGPTATAPETLAAGLYHVESAGIRGAKALDILTVAAKGAVVGHADLETVTNALIAAVNSGIKGTRDYAEAMGVLNSIIGAGNMRMEDLTAAFTTGILSSAKAFGVSIQSVGAAIADMTNQGVPAIDAATRLRMTISLLGAPTSKAAKELKSIGISQLELATAMRGPDGILGAVAMLKDHLDKSGLSATQQTALLSAAFGGGRSSSAILTLLGSLDKFRTIQNAVNAGTGQFGEAWAATQKDVNTKVQSVRASLDTLRITLGERLLPVASTVLDEFSKLLASPAVVAGVDQFGQAIAGLFTPDNITRAEQFAGQVATFAQTILPQLVSGLKIAGQVVSTAVSAFTSLPAPLQAAVIGGLAVNKLSGGLLGSGLMQVIQGVRFGATGGGGGVVGGLLGVQKVFVVNMPLGGLGAGGGLLPAAEGGAGLASTLAPLLVPALGVGISLAIVNATIEATKSVLTTKTTAELTARRDELDALIAHAKAPGAHGRFGSAAAFGPELALIQAELNRRGLIPSPISGAPTNLSGAAMVAERRAALGAQDFGPQPLTAVAQLSGSITHALQQAHLGGEGASMAEAITSKFTSSTAPSLRSMDSALGQLKTMQTRYLAQGDTRLAAAIGADLAKVKASIDAVTRAIAAKEFTAKVTEVFGQNYAGLAVAGAGALKPTTAPNIHANAVNLTVAVATSARQNTHAASVQSAYGPVSARGQAILPR